MKFIKHDADDWLTYEVIVNRECIRFKLVDLTEDQFWCLVSISVLHSPSHCDLRTRLLPKVEQQPDATLKHLVD